MSDTKHHSNTHGAGYEKRDIGVRSVLITTAIIVVFIIASVLFVDAIFVSTKESMVEKYTLLPESAQLRDLRARETEELTTYKLLDPAKQIYRIPIDRAMQLLADEAFRNAAPTGSK